LRESCARRDTCSFRLRAMMSGTRCGPSTSLVLLGCSGRRLSRHPAILGSIQYRISIDDLSDVICDLVNPSAARSPSDNPFFSLVERISPMAVPRIFGQWSLAVPQKKESGQHDLMLLQAVSLSHHGETPLPVTEPVSWKFGIPIACGSFRMQMSRAQERHVGK